MARRRRNWLAIPLALLVSALVCACASTPKPSPTPSRHASPSSTTLPLALRWVRTSAEYRAAAIQAYRVATVAVEGAASERKAGTWGVILDADETVLDNAQYQLERAEKGLAFSRESWAEWVSRRSAPALPGAVTFLRRVRELKGVIAIVTNRTEAQCADTDANLRQVQIAFDLLLCKPNDGSDDKSARFESVVQGTASPSQPPLDVVAWVGDNIRDFPQLNQELRRAPEDAFAEFGRRFFVIPNPLYGSWEKNP